VLLRLPVPEANPLTGGRFKHRPGQFVFLNIAAVSSIEWHPFSIASCDEKQLSVYVRCRGDWTSKLHDVAAAAPAAATLPVRIEGPYGDFGAHVNLQGDACRTVVMVGGGVGVTPMLGGAVKLLDEWANGRPLTRYPNDDPM